MTADDCPDEPDLLSGEAAERPVGLDAYGFPDHDGDTPPAADGPVTFGELKDHLMPPGTNKDALFAALKAAQVTGGQFPGRTAPDISGPGSGVPDVVKAAFPALGSAPDPVDPFTQADASDIALGEMFWGMVRGGIPKDSVERIIGHMLADMGPRSEREQG